MTPPKNIRIAAVGALAVALTAAGAAYSASKLRGSGSPSGAPVAAGMFVSSGAGQGHAFGRHGGPHEGRGLSAAATYLGVTVDALRTQLDAGKTLAQVADATSGKSASGLIDALVADATKRLGANAPSDLRQHITDLVNGAMPRFEHRMDGAPMMGPGGGMWAPAPMGRNS